MSLFSMDFSPVVNIQAKLIVHFLAFIANLSAFIKPTPCDF